jgi:hypothetical protein
LTALDLVDLGEIDSVVRDDTVGAGDVIEEGARKEKAP